jgi:hypothetical protein
VQEALGAQQAAIEKRLEQDAVGAQPTRQESVNECECSRAASSTKQATLRYGKGMHAAGNLSTGVQSMCGAQLCARQIACSRRAIRVSCQRDVGLDEELSTEYVA